MIGAAAAMLAAAVACSSERKGPESGPADRTKKVSTSVPRDMLEHGRGLYKAHCVACHGESGHGDGPAAGAMKPGPRDHTDRASMGTLSNDEIGRVIQMGGAIKGKPLMPSNPQLRGADLEALVVYVRSLSAAN
jgi:mono/diheme cytochrome c family protein